MIFRMIYKVEHAKFKFFQDLNIEMKCKPIMDFEVPTLMALVDMHS